MQANTNITRQDLLEFYLFKQRSCGKGRVRPIALAISPPMAITAAVLTLLALFVPRAVWSAATLVPLAAILPCYFLLLRCVSQRRVAKALDHWLLYPDAKALLGEQTVALETDGVSVVRSGQQMLYPWADISRVVAEDDHCYIFVGADKVIIIPSSSFADPDVFRVFVKMAVISHWHDERTSPVHHTSRSGRAQQRVSGPVLSVGSALALEPKVTV